MVEIGEIGLLASRPTQYNFSPYIVYIARHPIYSAGELFLRRTCFFLLYRSRYFKRNDMFHPLYSV